MGKEGEKSTFQNFLLFTLFLTIAISVPNIIFYSNSKVININPVFAWIMLFVNIFLLIASLIILVIVMINLLSSTKNKQSFTYKQKTYSQVPIDNKQDKSQFSVQSNSSMNVSPIITYQQNNLQENIQLEERAKKLTSFSVENS